jgi:hypothetical protein
MVQAKELSNGKRFYIADIENYNIEFLKEVIIDMYETLEELGGD